ncbi:MAG: nicotinate-nucleotide adenylyltransferase [bacterium]|nr:nicotinate-nucleotide adenylyltransferase [bacterium]
MSTKKNKKTHPTARRVVIYGGSFNPPHIGHAIAVEAVLRNFKCDEIWVMPSSERRDKHIGTSGKHRVKMLNILIKEFFEHSKIPVKIIALELDRPGLTTTYDTKTELERLYPKNGFYFLIGSELLWDIRYGWVRGNELWNSANFLAIRKPETKVPNKLPPNIKLADKDIVWVNISSTIIRNFIKKGYSGIPYLLPKISAYIKKNGLYR